MAIIALPLTTGKPWMVKNTLKSPLAGQEGTLI
jgi:hypothetical protein